MDFDDVINKRYSVRGYLDKDVEQEKLDYVLKKYFQEDQKNFLYYMD